MNDTGNLLGLLLGEEVVIIHVLLIVFRVINYANPIINIFGVINFALSLTQTMAIEPFKSGFYDFDTTKIWKDGSQKQRVYMGNVRWYADSGYTVTLQRYPGRTDKDSLYYLGLNKNKAIAEEMFCHMFSNFSEQGGNIVAEKVVI